MRIISGSKRGTKLFPPKGDTTRPILDRVKESIFDVLYKYDLIEGRKVADVFSGTGSFGLEALSRGASHVSFIEQTGQIVEILEKNIDKCDFFDESKIVKANAFKVGAPIWAGEEKFSLIFVDPPYAMSRETDEKSMLGRLMLVLAEQVADDGLVVVRTEKKVSPLDSYGKLSIIDSRTWGGMAVAFFRLESDDKQAGSNTDN
ncbi:MAG: 16S rRNA (guanine(966)-N(2))-methyltransferase RsmD [Anaerohalosphaeraceae bacterium]|nr:16S rRNA (guanine(966)-N(2))-methyltransferase RsmD [Anaerohalosphaeraceae bacterium]